MCDICAKQRRHLHSCSQSTRAFLRLSVPQMFQVSCPCLEGPTLLKRADERQTRQGKQGLKREWTGIGDNMPAHHAQVAKSGAVCTQSGGESVPRGCSLFSILYFFSAPSFVSSEPCRPPLESWLQGPTHERKASCSGLCRACGTLPSCLQALLLHWPKC